MILVLIYLGGIPPNDIRFRQPGAYHLARWMSKALYCLKILIVDFSYRYYFMFLKNLLNYNNKKLINEEENENSNKKLNVNFDDVSQFVNQDLPFSLLNNKSWKVFQRFKISINFLREDPKTWNALDEYIQAKEILSALKVVNDTAERGVKLMKEYNEKFTKNEDQKQFILQVVQEYHQQYPRFSREILRKTYAY
ncbi:Uncharacterized protein FWK35_00026340 [Aphis craccivora]|uniref:Uncharacterized protein n=1 Tax=Aphis craccivora TaxID=307492 RepID=A0A6G0Y7A6_APHCR|nr:Uncharacterized protein FWK35_00026340 [Aphis craccivora]